MDPLTMMVASIGMQFFSNYKNNKKSTELQQRQQEFQRAILNQDFERARRLQAESARLALELENEVHQQRLEDVKQNYDDVLHNFATKFTIENWPLNVLPFVMRGESFGSLFGGMSKSISVHCILTPSNSEWFNALFYDDIDLRLEAEMNNNWNAQSTHPIVYYGGGWNRRKRARGTIGVNPKTVPDLIDLNDIALLYTQLKSVPTIVITPYFDSDADAKLYFRVRLWGMGEDNPNSYRIDIDGNNDSDGQFHFTYDYHKNIEPENTEDFVEKSISEFVQYLKCLIGFVADKYFWSVYKVIPGLPKCIADAGDIYEKYNIRSLYVTELTNQIDASNAFSLSDVCRNIDYYESLLPLLDFDNQKKLEAKLLNTVKKLFAQRGDGIIAFANLADLKKCLGAKKSDKLSCKYLEISDMEQIESICVCEDTFDLSEYVEKFKAFIDDSGDRYDTKTVSLYIGHKAYKVFELHIYDINRKSLLISKDGFDYTINVRRVKNIFNVKSIFKNSAEGCIICRYERLEKLTATILNRDILIY